MVVISLSNNNKMHWAGYTPTVGRTSHIARAGQTHETRHTRRRHDSQRTDMIAATHTREKNRVREGGAAPSRVAPAVPSTPRPPHPLRKKKRGSPSLFSDTQSSGHAHQRIIRLLRERGAASPQHTRAHNALLHTNTTSLSIHVFGIFSLSLFCTPIPKSFPFYILLLVSSSCSLYGPSSTRACHDIVLPNHVDEHTTFPTPLSCLTLYW